MVTSTLGCPALASRRWGQGGLPPDGRKQLAGLMHNPSGRAGTVASYFPGLAAAYPGRRRTGHRGG